MLAPPGSLSRRRRLRCPGRAAAPPGAHFFHQSRGSSDAGPLSRETPGLAERIGRVGRASVKATAPGARLPYPWTRGFSLVEVAVALAIGVAVITVGVIVFQSLGAGRRATATFEFVTIGKPAMLNFYGLDAVGTDAFVAPNYGRRAAADRLRDLFWEDVGRSSAVFCLGRSGLNEQRPQIIAVAAGAVGRGTDSPDAFRALLPNPAAFVSYRGASGAQNASVFLLQPSADPEELVVHAIYDVDFVTTTSPKGTYVSVRRYVGTAMTDFYDVFYPEIAGGGSVAFSPVVVAFERSARRVSVEGDAVDRLKVARGGPFYFLWWPDPAAMDFGAATVGADGATEARASYAGMGGRTSLFFAVPMFPAL